MVKNLYESLTSKKLWKNPVHNRMPHLKSLKGILTGKTTGLWHWSLANPAVPAHTSHIVCTAPPGALAGLEDGNQWMEISPTHEETTQEVISRGHSRKVSPAAQIPSLGILQHIQCLWATGNCGGATQNLNRFIFTVIKCSELEGTHKEHQNPTPGTAQESQHVPGH